MNFDIDLATLGVLYTVWIPVFWATYILLSRNLSLSLGYLLFALVAQFIPWLGLVFLMLLVYFDLQRRHRNAKMEPNPNC
jgi:hypothetical protein